MPIWWLENEINSRINDHAEWEINSINSNELNFHFHQSRSWKVRKGEDEGVKFFHYVVNGLHEYSFDIMWMLIYNNNSHW